MKLTNITDIFQQELQIEKLIQEKIKRLKKNKLYQEIEKLRIEQDNLTTKRIHFNKKLIGEMRDKNITKIIEWNFSWEINELNWIEYIDIQIIK